MTVRCFQKKTISSRSSGAVVLVSGSTGESVDPVKCIARDRHGMRPQVSQEENGVSVMIS